MTSTATASWQNPKPLRNALTIWACRDDTRPDPKARAAADTALAAIDATITELAALGLRLEREIAGSEHAEIADDDGLCDEESLTVNGLLRCVLPRGHFPAVRHVDPAGQIFGAYSESPADDDSGYHDAAELDHDEQIAMAIDSSMLYTAAEEALTAEGYSVTEATRILACAEENGYSDDLLTVAMVKAPPCPRYTIRPADGPLSGSQLAVVHSSADTFLCDCGGRLLFPLKGGPDITCMRCGAVWEHDGIDIGGGARIKVPGNLPANASPMVAAL
ncbi:MAG TPA: hypothetical protein VGG16_29805 [Streptosporangiaceae bacterium]